MRTPVAVRQPPGSRRIRHHVCEASGQPRLNAQSPSERWDGDCALSSAEPVTPKT
jgi:hypothetical protein